MWVDFCLAILTGTAVLYGPGFFAWRALGMRGLAALSCAPLFSILAYSILGVVYFFLGVRSTALSVGLSVAVVSLAAYGLVLFVARRKGVALGSGERADRQFDAALVSAYLAVGVVVGLFAFVLPLDGPASSVQTYDNVHHFASVRSFSDSGMWSSLHVSSYLDVSDPAANPLPGTGYYPSGWHIVCSMVVSALGVEVALAVNAVNFLFAAIVFPLSMAFLMKVLFSGDRAIALIGALGAVAVGAFPWVLVEVWPLYPNTAAFALVPVLVACFAAVWGRDASRRERVAYGAVFVLGCCCMAFMQPNAVFSAAVFLIPFCVYRSAVEAGRRCREPKRRMEVMLAAGSVALACVALLWVAALSLPFMQGAVAVYWPPIHSRAQGLVSVLGMGFAGSSVQPIAACLVAAGALYTLRKRRYLWLTCSYLLACCIYYVSAVEGDTLLKHALSGFWYTDPYRTAALAGILALPLLAMGLYVACKIVGKTLASVRAPGENRLKALSLAVVAVAFLALNFLPVRGALGLGQGAFQGIAATATALNDGSAVNAYSEEKSRFSKHVKEVVPSGALIVNQPYDGSLFAYSLDDLNLYYRDISGYGGEDERPESSTIRCRLAAEASNPSVRDAVLTTGAEYLLVLDRDVERMKELFFLYDPAVWEGIEGVVDETPGFEMVLSEGDMRLYRIAYADAVQ